MLDLNPPDAYWKKDVVAFFSRRFALIIKMVYPIALIVPVAASGIPPEYIAAVIGIVAIMAGTFGAGETLTTDLNDGILMRVSLTPIPPQRLVFEVLSVNVILDFFQLLPPLILVFILNPAPPVWIAAALFGVFMTLVAANCIGIFIANFTSSPADVLLYATAILFPLIYISGFFRNQNPEGVMEVLRSLVPFAYMNDALQAVLGMTVQTSPAAVFVFPAIICAIMTVGVCLTAPKLLSPRL